MRHETAIIFNFELFIDWQKFVDILRLGSYINAMLQCCICGLLKVFH